MFMDEALARGILDVLAAVGDPGLRTSALGTQAGLLTDRDRITDQELRQALTWLRNKRWVAERDDEWGTPRWYITDAGANRQAMG